MVEIRLETSSKLLSTKPVIEHVDDGGTLGVGDLIKDLINLGWAVNTVRDLYRVTAEFAVKIKSHQLFCGEELRPDVELWEYLVHCQKGDPGCEPLLQPELVPPLDSHQVTEPLMGDLVTHEDGHVLLGAGGGHLGIKQERRLPEGQQAPVLHGTDVEIRDRNQIHLGQGVRGREELLEILNSLDSNIQGKLAVTSVLPGGEHCDGDPGACPLGQRGIPSNDHTHEVGGKRRACAEGHRLPHLLLDAHVGDHLHPRVRPDHGNVVSGPELGLIKTRKTFPGSSGLEVAGGAPPLGPRHVVLSAVEASHGVVQLPDVLDGYHERSTRTGDRLRELDQDDFLLFKKVK